MLRVSSNKWIEPAEIIAMRRANNNNGWIVMMTSGEDIFLTDAEYDSVVNYIPIGVVTKKEATTGKGGTSPVNIDDKFDEFSVVFLMQGSNQSSSFTYEINRSAINSGTKYVLAPWKDCTIKIINDVQSATEFNVMRGGVKTAVAYQSNTTFSSGTSPIFLTASANAIYISM